MAYNNRGQNQNGPQLQSEFVEEIVQVNRVSKKTKGGNKIGFAVLAVVGDKKGKVGVGHGKAADVAASIKKAVSAAKKHMIEVPIVKGTIPFGVRIKRGAAKVMLKPAPVGSGVIAGGAVRSVVSAAGIQNISSKVLGTGNQASNVYATIDALKQLSFLHQKFNQKAAHTETQKSSQKAQKKDASEVKGE